MNSFVAIRKHNFDLLRIICCFGVVLIHVSAVWFDYAVLCVKNGVAAETINGGAAVCIYNSIGRFAVPCFLMMSGAFILDDAKNGDYLSFYKKSIKRIGVPAAIFTGLYLIYNGCLCVLGAKNAEMILHEALAGEPMYHMWYVYMLIGVYALAPMIVRIRSGMPERHFVMAAIVLLIWASVSNYTSAYALSWDIGAAFEYIGYFVIGFCIFKYLKTTRLGAWGCITGGIVVLLIISYFEYLQIKNGLFFSEVTYSVIDPYSPLVMVASCLIFAGFTNIKCERSFFKIAKLTFLIYLIHVGVWDVACKALDVFFGENCIASQNPVIGIPTATVGVFLVSLLLAHIYSFITKAMAMKGRTKEKIEICDL